MKWWPLWQARVKEESENQWSNLFNATPIELDEGAGLEVQKVLEKAGAIDIGTRKKILNERGRTRNQGCIVFEQKNELLPVVAFALTRILPLINEYPAPDSEERLEIGQQRYRIVQRHQQARKRR